MWYNFILENNTLYEACKIQLSTVRPLALGKKKVGRHHFFLWVLMPRAIGYPSFCFCPISPRLSPSSRCAYHTCPSAWYLMPSKNRRIACRSTVFSCRAQAPPVFSVSSTEERGMDETGRRSTWFNGIYTNSGKLLIPER